MVTCKECVHFNVCKIRDEFENIIEEYNAEDCLCFKDRFKFLTVPKRIENLDKIALRDAKSVSDAVLTISHNMKFNGCKDPFRSYFNGVDDAVELCLNAIRIYLQRK